MGSVLRISFVRATILGPCNLNWSILGFPCFGKLLLVCSKIIVCWGKGQGCGNGTKRPKFKPAIIERVPEDVKNGVRFGCGLYFAEDVGKSLTYASWMTVGAWSRTRFLCLLFQFSLLHPDLEWLSG